MKKSMFRFMFMFVLAVSLMLRPWADANMDCLTAHMPLCLCIMI